MITQVSFQNFKALKNAELKLGPFNVIIGPNGSGKSSVLQGLQSIATPNIINLHQVVTAGMPISSFSVKLSLKFPNRRETVKLGPLGNSPIVLASVNQNDQLSDFFGQEGLETKKYLQGIETFSFQVASMSSPVDPRDPRNWCALNRDGSNLAGAITYLRDKDEDAYNQLRLEMQRWIPEYDSIGFETDQNGYRKLTFRQRNSRQIIPASQVSEGTLLTLALLTIVHQPDPTVLIGLEEPDRGLHPRLLRELRDALYRLSFPSDFRINRAPVQVVVTTHSPFFLDLFRDHPEQIIVAEKNADGTATFKNLSDDAGLREIIGDAPLSEVWYSGILGGVPAAA